MKRSVKNIISIGIILLMLIGIYLTMNSVKKEDYIDNMMNISQPNMDNKRFNRDFDNQDNSDFKNNRGMMPEVGGDDNYENRFKEPPMDENGFEMGNLPNENNNSNPSNMNKNFNIAVTKRLETIHYVIFAFNSLILSVNIIYLIMSNFNKKTYKEIFQDSLKLIIAILCSIILSGIVTFLSIYVANNYFIKNNDNNSIFFILPN